MIKTINTNLSNRLAPKPKHPLLAKSRQWHKWGGLIAAIFLIIVGATGIVLNYKQPIFTALGLENDPKEMKMKMSPEEKRARRERSPSGFTTVSGFGAATVTPDQALALAREMLGEVPLERIELKAEHGEMVYKIKAGSGDELWVNAMTGSRFVKGEYEKVKQSSDGAVVARRTDWGKIMLDLHTGKIGGEVGKAIMTTASVLLLLLSASGVYLWLKPVLIRRENARTKVAAPSAGAPALASAAAGKASAA
jgi:uncharacterized iron-regulated membrane protein